MKKQFDKADELASERARHVVHDAPDGTYGLISSGDNCLIVRQATLRPAASEAVAYSVLADAKGIVPNGDLGTLKADAMTEGIRRYSTVMIQWDGR